MKTSTSQIEIIAIQHKNKLNPITKQHLLLTLTPQELQKNERFIRWQDCENHLLGRVIIRSMILERFDIKPNDIYFSADKYGKPYAEGLKDFHFNITHSNEWVVVVCNNSPIGIDIEEIREIDLEIAKQFFSTKENELLVKLPLIQRKTFFYDLWTLKESFIKADGRGLYIPLNSFSIVNIDNNFHVIGSQENYHFKQYSIDKSYKLSVCALTNEFPERVRVMEVQPFIKKYLTQLNENT
ncbi:4'-phosphopantetheinyl transferase family protein [Bacillus ndiopicus]|uniref:4'-phosphopantetheinyl transferase family protein n=1 Tax=Bacillus ndiopicus TaxID=1347368 RepID=UPI000694BF60|nr:4'-phosphopantetheinyl transferase superfamily protein [Bacillus ndiopicus]